MSRQRRSAGLYFAYGSNLDPRQMRARCPGSRVVGRAVLANHALEFGGWSGAWGGPVATIVRCAGAQVEGVVYDLTRDDLRSLDGFEGHPVCYRREERRVLNEWGHWRRAHVYVQPPGTDPEQPPLAYLAVMLREYRRLGFDVGALAAAAGFSREEAA